jgi:hypothetical protein
VAMEYLGAGLGAGPPGSGLRARLRPGDRHSRRASSPVGSPGGVSFLPARLEQPAQAVRCPDCDTAVQYIVRDLIAIAIAAITGLDDCPSSANSSPRCKESGETSCDYCDDEDTPHLEADINDFADRSQRVRHAR